MARAVDLTPFLLFTAVLAGCLTGLGGVCSGRGGHIRITGFEVVELPVLSTPTLLEEDRTRNGHVQVTFVASRDLDVYSIEPHLRIDGQSLRLHGVGVEGMEGGRDYAYAGRFHGHVVANGTITVSWQSLDVADLHLSSGRNATLLLDVDTSVGCDAPLEETTMVAQANLLGPWTVARDPLVEADHEGPDARFGFDVRFAPASSDDRIRSAFAQLEFWGKPPSAGAGSSTEIRGVASFPKIAWEETPQGLRFYSAAGANDSAYTLSGHDWPLGRSFGAGPAVLILEYTYQPREGQPALARHAWIVEPSVGASGPASP